MKDTLIVKLQNGCWALGFLALSVSASAAESLDAPPDARLDELKREASAEVESMRKFTQVAVDTIFSYGELGFQEFETSRYVTGLLAENGFDVEMGMAGMPTAWMARWGSGEPVIAFGSDIDGIPKSSQKPGVAYHDPIIEGAPGHGEGHNSGQAVNVTAALVLKKIMEREGIPGTLILWPGVAEEQLGSKAWFVRDGYFKNVDVCVFTHVSRNLEHELGPEEAATVWCRLNTRSGANRLIRRARRGSGRSALDAVELMNAAMNARREHLRLSQRTHYVITNGGDQPNVVPSVASVWYYFRELDQPNIQRLFEIGNQAAKAAAIMTDTEVEWRILGTAYPGHFNKAIAEALYENIQVVGLPQWSEADQRVGESASKRDGRRARRARDGACRAHRACQGASDRRRLGRYRGYFLERAHGNASVPVQLPDGRGRPSLVERGRDGDSDRTPGRNRRRQSHGDDGTRPVSEPCRSRGGARILRATSKPRITSTRLSSPTTICRRFISTRRSWPGIATK